jgi:hypothetical protein
MRQVIAGVVLAIGGIAALIEAGSHHKAAYRATETGLDEHMITIEHAATGWSQTAYDLARIGGWALLIVGAVLLVVGLLRYRRQLLA